MESEIFFINLHLTIHSFTIYMYNLNKSNKTSKEFINELIIVLENENSSSLSITDFSSVNNMDIEVLFNNRILFKHFINCINKYYEIHWYNLIDYNFLFHLFVISHIREYGEILGMSLDIYLKHSGIK